MAVFVGTFVYAMAVLSQVRSKPDVFVPRLATWFGLILVLASVGVFIHYIHRMAHSVRAISLIASIAAETRAGIEDMYPQETGKQPAPPPPRPAGGPDQLVYHAGSPGVITAVDPDQLFETARSKDLVVEIIPKIGDFLPTGSLLLKVWGGLLDADRARAHVTFEIERTPNEDPGFGFRQLVDIAIRALSPGINDPTTAVQSLDHLHDLVRRLTLRAFPSSTRLDGDGHLRLILARPGYEDYVTLAFDEIRHYGRDSSQVVQRLRAALEDCIAIAGPHRREVLVDQLRQLNANRVERSHGEGST